MRVDVPGELYLYEEDFIRKNPLFVEAGSFSGNTTLHLKSTYPDSKVIVLEPSDNNYKLLLKNLKDYRGRRDVIFMKKALLDHDDDIDFYEFDTKSSNSMFARQSERKKIVKKITVPAIDILELIEHIRMVEYLDLPIDILFLNCEGSENIILERLFSQEYAIKGIRQICVSFHDNKIKQDTSVDKLLIEAEKHYIIEKHPPLKYNHYLFINRDIINGKK